MLAESGGGKDCGWGMESDDFVFGLSSKTWDGDDDDDVIDPRADFLSRRERKNKTSKKVNSFTYG